VAATGGVQRFKREGRILGQLTHPHVAELIDVGVTAKRRTLSRPGRASTGKHIDEYCDHHQLRNTIFKGSYYIFLSTADAACKDTAVFDCKCSTKPLFGPFCFRKEASDLLARFLGMVGTARRTASCREASEK
jgi:hypothetical protein